MVTPASISSILELSDQYDLFLFDQFGVLHDGIAPLKGMQEVISELKNRSKVVSVISNSGKRSAYNSTRLSQFGFDPELFDSVVTSGEVAWHLLSAKLAKSGAGVMHRVLFVGRGSDRSALEGLPIVEVGDVDEADFVLLSGCDPELKSLEQYLDELLPAAYSGITLYCTNPDHLSLAGKGRVTYGPGAVADQYQAAGGKVVWIGKPYELIYEYLFKLHGTKRERAVAIGDSVEHDIKGASTAGCASILVRTGIHEKCTSLQLSELFHEYDCHPDFVLKGCQ